MKKTFFGFCALILSLSTITFFPLKTRAATLDVCPACAYTTIQTAVAAASNGDTINVAAGTYNEEVVITSIDNLTLQGAGEETAILAGDASPGSVGLNVVTSSNFKLDGFGITNYEAGLYLEDGSAEISNNRFYNNDTEIDAAAVIIDETSTNFHDNIVENNSGDYFGLASLMVSGTTNIHHNQFSRNTAGILALGPINVYQNQITSNSMAGIIGFEASGSIYNNSITSGTGGYYEGFGGGIFLLGSDVEIFNNRIEENNGYFGTGIALIDSFELMRQNIIPQIYNNYIANNTGVGGGAGVLLVENSTPIFNNTIVNNSATGGTLPPTPSPGLQSTDAKIRSQLSFSSNFPGIKERVDQVKAADEPKIFAAGNKLRLATDNGDEMGGGILIANEDAAGPNIYNNIIWGNTDDIYDIYSNSRITYSDIGENIAGQGNIHGDPRLTGLYLNQDSPAIDAGTRNGAPTTDILGGARPQNGGVDMGAYELVPILPLSGVLDPAKTNSSSPRPNYLLIIILTVPLPAIYFLLKKLLKTK